MANLRTLYNNEAVLVACSANPLTPPHPTGDHDTDDLKLLERVQSFDLSVNIPLEDINEFTQLATIDRLNLEGADVSANISYLFADLSNEMKIGFKIDNSAGFVSPATGPFLEGGDERNYWKAVANEEGEDINEKTNTNYSAIGIGNALLSSYSLEGSVGGFVTSTVGVQGQNATATATLANVDTPGVQLDGTAGEGLITGPIIQRTLTPQKPAVLKAGDVDVSITNSAGVDTFFAQDKDSLNFQSFNISIDFNREPIYKLGSPLPIARTPTFPLAYNVQLEALATSIEADQLLDYLCGGNLIDVEFSFGVGGCGDGFLYSGEGTGLPVPSQRALVVCRGLSLESQDFSTSIGPNATVSISLQGQIGGPSDALNGLFMSGVTGYTDSTTVGVSTAIDAQADFGQTFDFVA